MREKLKSLLLILLFISSLYFIKILWFEGPGNFFKKDEGELDQAKYLSEIIKPDNYLLRLSSRENYIIYSDSSNRLWNEAKIILADLFKDKSLKISRMSYLDYEKRDSHKALIYYFPYEVNSYLLMESLNLNNKELISRIPKIDSILIPLKEDENEGLIFALGEKYYLIEGEDIDLSTLTLEIEKISKTSKLERDYLIRKAYKLDNNKYIPYKDSCKVDNIYVDNIFLSLGEKDKNSLAEKFLDKDIDYIREIVEDNSSNIYIYNKTIFKINSSGLIEYFNPLSEKILERNLLLSLTSAVEFMEKVGVLEDGIYLYNIEEIEKDGNLGYRLAFKNKLRGLDLEINTSLVGEYISIEVFNSKIRSFSKYGRKIAFIEEKEAAPRLSALDLVKINTELDLENYIDSIKLAYYDQGLLNRSEKLILVWILDTGDERMIFDAYKGNLIDIKKISR